MELMYTCKGTRTPHTQPWKCSQEAKTVSLEPSGHDVCMYIAVRDHQIDVQGK